MPAKKKTAVPTESGNETVAEPKKSLASIKSFNKETDAPVSKSVTTKSKAKPVVEKADRTKFTAVLLFATVGVLLFAAVGAAVYFYRAYRQATDAKPVVNETERLVMRLSQFMELPQGETPTLATVTDKTKLAGQEFFLKAENGDQVLIYQNAAKAILFRPSTGKIVNFAPVNTKETSGDPQSSETVQQSQTMPVEEPTSEAVSQSAAQQVQQDAVSDTVPVGKTKIALYNGSTTIGITAKVEKDILGNFAESMDVISKDSAAKKDYEGTTVVDLSGTRAREVSTLADFLGGSVAAAFPDSEPIPEGADVVVLIGNEKK